MRIIAGHSGKELQPPASDPSFAKIGSVIYLVSMELPVPAGHGFASCISKASGPRVMT